LWVSLWVKRKETDRTSDTLIGAIVGGVIAVVGGFGGAWFIRWRDDSRADRDREEKRMGTINVLLSELAENHTNLQLRIEAAQRTRMEVHDQAFREAQAFLALEVRPTTWEAVYKAYAQLRSQNHLYDVYSPAQSSDAYVIRREAAAAVLLQLAEAAEALRQERGRRPAK